MAKRLYRSEQNKMLGGVIGGIGDYFNVDATLLRLIFIVTLVLTGVFPLLIAYVVAVLVMPRKGARGDVIDVDETTAK